LSGFPDRKAAFRFLLGYSLDMYKLLVSRGYTPTLAIRADWAPTQRCCRLAP